MSEYPDVIGDFSRSFDCHDSCRVPVPWATRFGSWEPATKSSLVTSPSHRAARSRLRFEPISSGFSSALMRMRPTSILGCFGRAYHRYPELNLNVLSVLSNHGCFVATRVCTRDVELHAGLPVNGGQATQPASRSWGHLLGTTVSGIPIVDEASLEDFRYVLTQGTKEDLVWSARDWPGVSSARALLGGPGLVGRWRDQSAEGALRRQRERKIQRAQARGCTLDLPRAPQVWREYPIDLVPLPHWRDLKVGQRRARVAAMLHQDDGQREPATNVRARTARPPGLFAASPFNRPAKPAKSPAPRCHADSRARRDAFRVVYRAFANRLRASDTVSTGLAAARVPLHGTLPPLGHHPTLLPRRPDATAGSWTARQTCNWRRRHGSARARRSGLTLCLHEPTWFPLRPATALALRVPCVRSSANGMSGAPDGALGEGFRQLDQRGRLASNHDL